jgi:hypothetical protein
MARFANNVKTKNGSYLMINAFKLVSLNNSKILKSVYLALGKILTSLFKLIIILKQDIIIFHSDYSIFMLISTFCKTRKSGLECKISKKTYFFQH